MIKVIANKEMYYILNINGEGKVTSVKCGSWSGWELSHTRQRREAKTRASIKLAEVVLLESRLGLAVSGDAA